MESCGPGDIERKWPKLTRQLSDDGKLPHPNCGNHYAWPTPTQLCQSNFMSNFSIASRWIFLHIARTSIKPGINKWHGFWRGQVWCCHLSAFLGLFTTDPFTYSYKPPKDTWFLQELLPAKFCHSDFHLASALRHPVLSGTPSQCVFFQWWAPCSFTSSAGSRPDCLPGQAPNNLEFVHFHTSMKTDDHRIFCLFLCRCHATSLVPLFINWVI